MINKWLNRIGRRKAILRVLGSLWILTGISILLNGPAQPISGVLHTYLPGWIRVVAWALTGAIAVVAASIPDREPSLEAAGYASLYIMPAERALSYLSGWITSWEWIPGTGFANGWAVCLQYLGYVAIIYICSGWFEQRGPDER